MTIRNNYENNTKLSKMPSLSTLIAFERVALFLSITKAAEDLCRSPSTISYAINELETRYGDIIFDRTNGKIGLTESGSRYLVQIREALTILNHSGQIVSEGGV